MKDSIKQTGKYLGDTGERREIALKRVAPIIPITDRVRDFFDDADPMEMHFNMPKDNTQVHMDLRFLPYPFNIDRTQCGDCHCRTSEVFYGGETTYTLLHDFDDTTVRVYVAGERTTNFTVSASDSIDLLDTTTSDQIITITYVYAYDLICDDGSDIPNYEGSLFAGYQASYDPGGIRQDIAFQTDGDHPLAGWGAAPKSGPIDYDQSSLPFRSITIEEPAEVRIWAKIAFSTVINMSGTASLQVYSTTRGLIGQDTINMTSGGLQYYAEFLSVDLRNQQLSPGESIFCDAIGTGFLAGGFGGGGPGLTFLYIFRGTYSIFGVGTITGP